MSRDDEKGSGFKEVFKGNDEGWQDFYDKFLAFGESKKWWTALEADATGDDSEEKKNARKKARYALIMCTQGDAAEYVRAEPDPYYGWLSLLERYDNKDGNDLKSLYQKWDDTMSSGPGLKDPKLWFLKLAKREAEIVAAGGKTKDPTEFVLLLETTMIGVKEYESVVELIGMQEKRNDLDFWKKQLFDFWKRKLKENYTKKNEDDVAFIAEGASKYDVKKNFKKSGYKPFKGVCNKCGKIGHKAYQCRAPESTRDTQENRKCFKCHLRGHIAKDCPRRNLQVVENRNSRVVENRAAEAMFVGVIEEQENYYACKPCKYERVGASIPAIKSRDGISTHPIVSRDGTIPNTIPTNMSRGGMSTRPTASRDGMMRDGTISNKKSWFEICDESDDDDDESVDAWEDVVMVTINDRRVKIESYAPIQDELIFPRVRVKTEDNDGNYSEDATDEEFDDDDVDRSGNEEEDAFEYFFDDHSVNIAMMSDGLMDDSSDDDTDKEEDAEDHPAKSADDSICEKCVFLSDRKIICDDCDAEKWERGWRLSERRRLSSIEGRPIYDTKLRVEMMNRSGIGVCSKCVGIGPINTSCLFCTICNEQGNPTSIFMYQTPEVTLLNGNGFCFSCTDLGVQSYGPPGQLCTKCSHGWFVTVPIISPTTGSFELVENPSEPEQHDNSRNHMVMSIGGVFDNQTHLPASISRSLSECYSPSRLGRH